MPELPRPELLLERAQQYLDRGFSVFPVTIKEDGSFKKAAVKWKEFQQRQPTLKELQKMFNRSHVTGLALSLGPVSGEVYVRDFDDCDAYRRWAAAYPELAKVLPTVKTARGNHVYFRSTRVLRTNVFNDGELRGLGGYSILPPSVHQTGHVYEWINPPPAGSLPVHDAHEAGFCQAWGCTEGTERPESTEDDRDNRCGSCVGSVCSVSSEPSGNFVVSGNSGNSVLSVQGEPLSEKGLIDMAMPDDKHQNHKKVFQLARGVLTLEKQQGRKWSQPEQQKLFDAWYQRVEAFLRDGQGRDDYWFEFLDALDNAKYPLGEEPITQAWERAQKSSPPKVAEQFVDPQVRLLVTLCRELQRSAGEEEFYLSCRTVARLFAHKDHTKGASWLRGLTKCKIIQEITKGGPKTQKASRYRYLHPLDDNAGSIIEPAKTAQQEAA